jgi:hypothetical protein
MYKCADVVTALYCRTTALSLHDQHAIACKTNSSANVARAIHELLEIKNKLLKKPIRDAISDQFRQLIATVNEIRNSDQAATAHEQNKFNARHREKHKR